MILPPIIAVDFDGCLCHNEWPEIGAPNFSAINELIKRRRNGAKVVLWTCRTGEALMDAVNFCRDYGLRFDAVNENLPEVVAEFGGNTRKIFAHEYWDDKAVVCCAR